MANVMGLLRRRVLTPSTSQARFTVRGFEPTARDRQQVLENVGRMFLTGYGHGMQARDSSEAGALLRTVLPQYQGFSFEGCAMALTVRDALTPWPSRRLADYLAGPAADHVYMVHIGVGMAMGRLPAARWRAVFPPHPVLQWLVWDGYGFHQAYFRTDRYVRDQYLPPRYPGWLPYSADQINRTVDQGVGRALWFVAGADVARCADTIRRFDRTRWPDLFSGAGLACAYAGGIDDVAELEDFATAAGPRRADVAQAVAFAAKTRLMPGLVTPNTERTVKVFCGCSVEEAAAVVDEAYEDLPRGGDIPPYEVWRQRTRDRFR